MQQIEWGNVTVFLEERSKVELCPIELLETVRQKKILYARSDEQRKQQHENGSFLRHALEEYFGSLPQEPLQLCYNCYGKPYLEGDAGYFSLSHSGELLVCAVSGEEVGADVEVFRTLRQDISRKILSEEEQEIFQALPQKEKNDWLIRVWTEKESIGKLLGTGIRTPKELKKTDYVTKTWERNGACLTAAKRL